MVAVEEEPPLNPLADSTLVVVVSELLVLGTRAEAHRTRRVQVQAVVAAAVHVQRAKQVTAL